MAFSRRAFLEVTTSQLLDNTGNTDATTRTRIPSLGGRGDDWTCVQILCGVRRRRIQPVPHGQHLDRLIVRIFRSLPVAITLSDLPIRLRAAPAAPALQTSPAPKARDALCSACRPL